MAKLTRIYQRLFASAAAADEIGEFGSLAEGTPTTTTDPATAMSRAGWLGGWYSAILGSNSPCIEDMNAGFFIFAYQLGYLMQTGIAEWDSTTIYFIGSLVNNGSGVIYQSLTNSNTNNALTSVANWRVYGESTTAMSATGNIASTAGFVRADPTSASFVATLPAISATPLYKKIRVKNIATNGNSVTVQCNGADVMDRGATTLILNSDPICDCVEFFNNGTTWDII